ncbi:conserved exported hypothetical protein [Candidatus Nitrotoga sp. BS]|uniref:hypothetical protein n=1 Tax=Candidatus Nitrotoga sp. BS TaxID=2890408 RepID=UPI001EF1F169|nr:hypothetical protein [Candidatus Nitrotoga sp. BS]CAH1192829.1 conserved exported hypothetical protein [Candidatus Nitrotoga sp. BS]
MQKFKIKSLSLALVATVSSVGIANTVNAAVHLSGNGLGQVLIFPYYTTRAGMDTYLSVLNTTASSKVLKVNFYEGKNSREVITFNLHLSPYDMWTAAIVNTANGAKLVTADKSCTAPRIPADGKEFMNFTFWGFALEGIGIIGGDGETASLDRTREGYFEIIEMGTVTNTAINTSITHASGVPANCAVVQAVTMDMGPNSVLEVGGQSAKADPPTGGLAGTASLINVTGGTDYGYEPTVLEAFAPSQAKNIWYVPGHIYPDLTSSDRTSIVISGGSIVTSNWNNGEDAVSALLMHDSIINESIFDQTTLSGTDWVITMPTKRYKVPVHNPALAADTTQLYSPFTHKFWTGGACEPINDNYAFLFQSFWNREGQEVHYLYGVPPPGLATFLCWGANVVTFNSSHVLGSFNESNISIPFENGWLKMTFKTYDECCNNYQPLGQMNGNGVASQYISQSITSVNGDTYIGLPTIGFMVQNFINQNAAPGVMATYGGNFNHKYTTSITHAPF